MIAVSPTPNRITAPVTNQAARDDSRTRARASDTDQHSSHDVSAKVIGLRSETGPFTSPPVTTSATACPTRTASSSQPTRQSSALCAVTWSHRRRAP